MLSQSLLTLVERNKSSAREAMIFNIIFSLVIIILAIYVGMSIVRDLNNRVKDLMFVMSEVGDNNDLTVQTKIQGNSELGQIASALNTTLKTFAQVISQINLSSVELSSAAEETAKNCGENSLSMEQQQNAVTTIAAAIEELSITVQEVATNTQSTTDAAKLANSQVKDGQEIVKQAYISIESLANEINDLAKVIHNLHDSSNNITNVVDVIKSVAEQTNLLALNAAIEAARAGEQGRGFAVVADEVRTLAQRTQTSTIEIESFINSLQADVKVAYNVISLSQNKAQESIDSSKNAENMLDSVTLAVGEIFKMTEQIAVAIEEQATVTQDVARHVIDVEQHSVQSAAGANQIASTAKEQAALALSLQTVAHSFKIDSNKGAAGLA
jgi:methyl-accepting chemotaxis protein